MEPRIEIVDVRKFVGKRTVMSFDRNTTHELRKEFMPAKAKIPNSIGAALYSIEIYSTHFFDSFDPARQFEKWAAVEVTALGSMADGMEALLCPGGEYAVFVHEGPASNGPKTYEYIFTSWLPNSGFVLDDRPHFAVMGEKYRYDNPESEEEIWIPIRRK